MLNQPFYDPDELNSRQLRHNSFHPSVSTNHAFLPKVWPWAKKVASILPRERRNVIDGEATYGPNQVPSRI